MLDAEQKVFVTAALGAVVAGPLSTITAAEEAGQEVVVEVADPAAPADPGVALEQDDGEEP